MDPEASNDSPPRFSVVTLDDHSGQLWILTILSLIYSALVVMARAYIKYQMFGFDDILIAFATALHLGQSIALFVGLGNGLGKFNSITQPEEWATSSRSTLAAVVLFQLSLAFAKCSVLALILRIIGTRTGKSRLLCIGLMGLCAAWGIGSCLAFLISCRADTLLTLDNVQQCPNQEARWAVITAVDILTEILIWVLIARLSWTVTMSFKRKCQVIMAFSFRLPLIVLSALHLAYFNEYPASEEPQFAVTNSLLFQQAIILWSLISATVPNLKNFLKSFSIGMGFPIAFDITMYGSSNAYQLQSMENQRSKTTSSAARAGPAGASTSVSVHDHSDGERRGRPPNWRSDHVMNQTTVESHHYSSNSWDNSPDEDKSSRNGSQELIINKEVVVKVTHETRQ